MQRLNLPPETVQASDEIEPAKHLAHSPHLVNTTDSH